MAENTNSGGGNTGLAFIVGAVVVVLAIVAWFVFARGGVVTDAKDVNVDINLPAVEAPTLPPVEPPTLPAPGPAPSN